MQSVWINDATIRQVKCFNCRLFKNGKEWNQMEAQIRLPELTTKAQKWCLVHRRARPCSACMWIIQFRNEFCVLCCIWQWKEARNGLTCILPQQRSGFFVQCEFLHSALTPGSTDCKRHEFLSPNLGLSDTPRFFFFILLNNNCTQHFGIAHCSTE